MARKKSSLRDLAAKAREPGLAAANTPVANRIVELDPALVHAGGLEDRIGVDTMEIEALAESIQAAGQQVPILVRPHPERPGEYQVIAGRRRLAACHLAGLAVRAEIQDVDVRALVMGQAIENIAREDLSYIERARLAARMVDEAGLEPKDIEIAFSCGKTERSRYLKVGRALPGDVILFVGKATGVGRPRWEALAERLQTDPKAIERVRAALAAANDVAPTPAASDARFALVFAAAEPPAVNQADASTTGARVAGTELHVPGYERPVGTLRRTAKGVQMTVLAKTDPGFAMWLEAHADDAARALFDLYRSDTAADDDHDPDADHDPAPDDK